MSGVINFALVLCLATVVGQAPATPTPTPVPARRQALNDAWWTGPMLAPGAGTLPRGHILVEPYFFDVMQYGTYNSSGRQVSATHSHTFGNFTYLIFGIADRLSLGFTPTTTYTYVDGGPNSSALSFGDLGVLLQYRLTQYTTDHRVPTMSIAVQENVPTGRFDNLGPNPTDGVGSGAYSTKISLYSQTYAWMPNGRILRARLNLSQTFSSSTAISGASVYGTGTSFSGSARPGNIFSVDAAAEYSATRNWVLASDLVYTHASNTHVSGGMLVTDSGDSQSWAIAPGIEYNWTPNVGVLFALRAYPAGKNVSASLTPAIAINIVH